MGGSTEFWPELASERRRFWQSFGGDKVGSGIERGGLAWWRSGGGGLADGWGVGLESAGYGGLGDKKWFSDGPMVVPGRDVAGCSWAVVVVSLSFWRTGGRGEIPEAVPIAVSLSSELVME